jgi:hypothetical protein
VNSKESDLKKEELAHHLRIMGREGDTAVAWRPSYQIEVDVAKGKFDEMLGQGYAMFAVETPGAKPVQTRSFDPSAFEILAVPALKGG